VSQFGLPRPLCSRVILDIRDRQSDVKPSIGGIERLKVIRVLFSLCERIPYICHYGFVVDIGNSGPDVH